MWQQTCTDHLLVHLHKTQYTQSDEEQLYFHLQVNLLPTSPSSPKFPGLDHCSISKKQMTAKIAKQSRGPDWNWLSAFLIFALTWIWDACRSMVIIWSAPATDSMFATNLAEIGARLWYKKKNDSIRQVQLLHQDVSLLLPGSDSQAVTKRSTH